MTPDLLREATGCTAERAALFAEHLSNACDAYSITTPERLAAFLAQVGHESGALRHVVEVWGPTAAQAGYEGRRDLGNTVAGDGYRYRGRGLLQTTGRANYRALTARLRARLPSCPDFEADPDELMQPRWAAYSAADYWDMRGINAPADAGDFQTVTRRINGGLNGYEDRLARWAVAKEALRVDNPAPIETIELPKERTMAFPALLAALLPSLIESIPKLATIFKPGSAVAERNVQAASIAFDIAKTALSASNEQEVIERIKSDPTAATTVAKAIENNWFQLAEAGGGGIEGARKADDTAREKRDMLYSPSFYVALALLPLVYLIVGAIVGLWGSPFSDEVRSAIANGIVGMIIGALAGYYFGQSTSRNRQQ